MAKKLVAVTNIKNNGEFTPAGETLDASKFDKKQLEALYDAGAVRVDGSDTSKTETESTSTNVTSADQSAEASSPANTTSSTKAAAGTKETVSGKGNSK